jgi:hypothetical protein
LFVSPDAFLRDGLEYSSEGQQWLQPMSAPGTVPFRRPVIKSFRDEEIGKGLETRVLKRLPRTTQERALMKLQQLNAAGGPLSVSAGLQLAAIRLSSAIWSLDSL